MSLYKSTEGIVYKGFVHLQGVNGEPGQHSQRRITRSEIIRL